MVAESGWWRGMESEGEFGFEMSGLEFDIHISYFIFIFIIFISSIINGMILIVGVIRLLDS